MGSVQPFILEYDISFDSEGTNSVPLMEGVLQEYLGQADDYWIPYDFSERMEKFPFAFEQLVKYNEKMRPVQ